MRGDRSILHIDDDLQVTRIVAERLRLHGYDVTSLNEPYQAIATLSQARFRVVILDIDMPHLNGLDLLREIKRHDGGIQVIMLTGMVTLTTVLESFRLGAEACFFKPLLELDPLLEALGDTFRKIDRWWGTLADLSQRRRDQTRMTDDSSSSQ